jgi:transposase-like protein
MSTNPARQPQGVPIGGQFATMAHPESDLQLSDAPDAPDRCGVEQPGGHQPRYPQLRDQGWLEREYVGHGRSTYDIAMDVGCSPHAVTHWLHCHGIPARPSRNQPKYPQLQDRDWLEQEYVEHGRTTYDIAEEIGCDPQVVGGWLRRHDIQARSAAETQLKHPKLQDRDWLEQEYVERGRTTSDIAEGIGCHPASVGRWLHRHGIPARTSSLPSRSTHRTEPDGLPNSPPSNQI